MLLKELKPIVKEIEAAVKQLEIAQSKEAIDAAEQAYLAARPWALDGLRDIRDSNRWGAGAQDCAYRVNKADRDYTWAYSAARRRFA